MKYDDFIFPSGTKFLVTGGAGFIGSNLCEMILTMGYSVRCLDNLSTGSRSNVDMFVNNSNYEFIHGDIRDFETCMKSCDGVDYVLHQAAWGSVPRSIEMPLLYEEINIKGTLNMLEAARQKRVKKFVYASSSSVYGDEPNLPKKEGREGKLLSPYALTKKVNEDYGKIYYDLYNLNTIGLRYFNVFGKRQNPNGTYAAVIPKIVNQLLKGEIPVIFGDGNQSRDFTYIENVIQANLKACLSSENSSGKVYNIAYGGRVTLNEVYKLIQKLLNMHIQPNYAPFRKGDIEHSNADIGLAREYLHYYPEWSFEMGLKETIEWYKNNV